MSHRVLSFSRIYTVDFYIDDANLIWKIYLERRSLFFYFSFCLYNRARLVYQQISRAYTIGKFARRGRGNTGLLRRFFNCAARQQRGGVMPSRKNTGITTS